MAKIVDPDNLNNGTEVIYNTTNKTIQLAIAGNLTTDGVTGQCVYSFCREQWKTSSTLIKYPFPLYPIDGPSGTQYHLENGWTWYDTTTTDLIKDAGWALKNSSGDSLEEWMNITSLGGFNNSADKAWYIQVEDKTTSNTVTNTTYSGRVNQAIKIYGDSTHGNFDYRDYFKIFLRGQAEKYVEYDLLTNQALSSLTYKKYSLPLSNSPDTLKVTHTDSEIEQSPYTNITMTYESPSVSRNVGGSDYNFDYLWDGDNKTPEQIYEKQMYLLRQATDIDSGSGDIQGKIQSGIFDGAMMKFEGDTLHVQGYVDNLSDTYSDRVVFYDDTGTPRIPTVINTFKFTVNPSVTGYEYHIYSVDAIGSLNGAVELQGKETAASDNYTYSYVYSSDTPIAVQLLFTGSLDYVESDTYYTLTNTNKDVIINLEKDLNN